MPRAKRAIAESGYYHVTMRGAGRRALFEDDTDKEEFVKRLRSLAEDGVTVHAWCLMDNHVHLLISSTGHGISEPIHKLCTSYALYFNGRHAHVGPVFQGRFASFPVETDFHLLETVRYIHLNPREAGIANPEDYIWSSYNEYLGKDEDICDTALVRGMLGDADAFVRFHNIKARVDFVDLTGYQRRMSDAEAREMAVRVVGAGFPDSLSICETSKRDIYLKRLNQMGISTRQLERITGIGRAIIRRACTVGHTRCSPRKK